MRRYYSNLLASVNATNIPVVTHHQDARLCRLILDPSNPLWIRNSSCIVALSGNIQMTQILEGGALQSTTRSLFSYTSPYLLKLQADVESKEPEVLLSAPVANSKLTILNRNGQGDLWVRRGAFVASTTWFSLEGYSAFYKNKALPLSMRWGLRIRGCGSVILAAPCRISSLESRPDRPLIVDARSLVAWDANLVMEPCVRSPSFPTLSLSQTKVKDTFLVLWQYLKQAYQVWIKQRPQRHFVRVFGPGHIYVANRPPTLQWQRLIENEHFNDMVEASQEPLQPSFWQLLRKRFQRK